MPVQGVTDGYGPVVGEASRNYSEVSKIDFMKLLVAQIQNQDPMSPMDNAQFTSQITEMTMLEETQKMNANLEDNIMVGQSINNTAMLALVGKDVTVEGNNLSLTGGQSSQNVIASTGPGTATIEVTDSGGHVVDSFRIPVDAGLNDFNWDGLLEDDVVAPDGKYTLSISVTNGDIDVPFTSLLTGPVESLRYDNGVGVVTVGGSEFYVSEIYKIS